MENWYKIKKGEKEKKRKVIFSRKRPSEWLFVPIVICAWDLMLQPSHPRFWAKLMDLHVGALAFIRVKCLKGCLCFQETDYQEKEGVPAFDSGNIPFHL